eukprot:4600417-Prymnesium_polylepis.1
MATGSALIVRLRFRCPHAQMPEAEPVRWTGRCRSVLESRTAEKSAVCCVDLAMCSVREERPECFYVRYVRVRKDPLDAPARPGAAASTGFGA